MPDTEPEAIDRHPVAVVITGFALLTAVSYASYGSESALIIMLWAVVCCVFVYWVSGGFAALSD